MGAEPAKPFFDGLLNTPVLFSAILAYNGHAQAQEMADTDDLAQALAPWFAGLPDHARTQRKAPAAFFWDFAEESTRVVFLTDSQLREVAALLGVTVHAKAIAECILRTEREALRQVIGDALYTYALTRGQYLVGRAAALVQDWDVQEPLRNRVQWHGWRLFWCLAARWPDVLSTPFRARIARAWEGAREDIPPLTQSALDVLWRCVKKCLVREVTPSWRPYFTP